MKTTDFQTILIANRAEIALRIIRSVRALGKRSVAIYATDDRELPFVSEADEAYPLGEGNLGDTYLNIGKIIDLAKRCGADAIHPGYGFLSEKAGFARACEESGIVFIGPGSAAIELMGDKIKARESARSAGVPLIEGLSDSPAAILSQKDSLSFPLLVKAAAGGGGKGMRRVDAAADLEDALESAAREALNFFGSPEVYVETLLEKPRHIEVQVLADTHGKALHLFERECSMQRRHQKVIEEAPAPKLQRETKEALYRDALKLVRSMGYVNAGTIEFLVDTQGRHYFLEMNTRIQVEHPVTEMITGIDLVREQIHIAEGRPLAFDQDDIRIKGHAIECRIYAEDPERDFMPDTGKIREFRLYGEDSGLRLDTGYTGGNCIGSSYDPMLAKLIAWSDDRETAVEKLRKGLKNLYLEGPANNRDFLGWLLGTPDFQQADIHTFYMEQKLEELLTAFRAARAEISRNSKLTAAAMLCLHPEKDGRAVSVWKELGPWRLLPSLKLTLDDEPVEMPYRKLPGKGFRLQLPDTLADLSVQMNQDGQFLVMMDGRSIRFRGGKKGPEIFIDLEGFQFRLRRRDIPDPDPQIRSRKDDGEGLRNISAPLNGKVVKVLCREEDVVEAGEALLIIESMKMENKIQAPARLKVGKILVSENELVQANQLILTLEEYESSTDHKRSRATP